MHIQNFRNLLFLLIKILKYNSNKWVASLAEQNLNNTRWCPVANKSFKSFQKCNFNYLYMYINFYVFFLVLQCSCKGGVQFSKVYKIVIGFALVLKQYYGINDYKYCLHFDYWRICKIQHKRGQREQIDLCQQIVVTSTCGIIGNNWGFFLNSIHMFENIIYVPIYVD